MSDPSLDDLERRLQELPREAWDRPVPPPAPWPAAEEAPARRRRRRLVLRPVAALAASALLLGAGVGAGLLLSGDDEAPGGSAAASVELEPFDGRGKGASGSVELEPRAGGSATVRLSGLRPNGEDDFYELWLIGADGELVSLGSVRVPDSGTAELTTQLPVDPQRFEFLDVSREPGDGDPGHSSISVLRGPAA